ncbi:hypothetical protein GCK72_006054 [Caenorhabditis remanei]|uniref:Uncharacterized protein n=1 Tax=Caenorhabditis remanei TaxID=31234 RepID=A0A6A5HEA0_CAERE|nr:hypothetical protein GCK72_006054 [Caenorhabditis remanei]KAF1766098.1 hypothetical protein GCK72_006054 [Caenorhabditis remanei]
MLPSFLLVGEIVNTCEINDRHNLDQLKIQMEIERKTIPSAETVISPIELEMIRDEQNKEILEQRRLMKQRNGGLQCYLASQTEERQYLESKLNEAQEKQKIEKHLIMKNLPRSDSQTETMKKNRAAK